MKRSISAADAAYETAATKSWLEAESVYVCVAARAEEDGYERTEGPAGGRIAFRRPVKRDPAASLPEPHLRSR